MFSGLTSRCTSPARCAADSALSTGSMIETASAGREPAALAQQVAQGAALDQLHDEEHVVTVGPDLVTLVVDRRRR